MDSQPDLANRVVSLRDSNALEGFLRESDLTNPAETPAPAPSSPLSLAELQSAGVQIEWDEAVAVAQALCQVFLVAQVTRRIVAPADGRGDRATLDIQDVFIDKNGRVSIGQNNPQTVPEAIEAVGKVLARILPAKDPLALKARIVSKATSVPPLFGSVEELSRTLEGYERRNWTELIRALYERFQNRSKAVSAASSNPSETSDTVVAKSAARVTAQASSRAVPVVRRALTFFRWQYLRYPAGAVAALVLVAGGWFLVNRWSASSGADAPVAPANPEITAEAVPAETSSGPSASAKPIQRGGASSKEIGATGSAGRTRARRDGTIGSASNDPGTAADSVPAAASAAAAANGSPRESTAAVARSAGSVTYSVGDRDVIPPSVIYPTLLEVLSPVSPGVRREMLTIAVLVNERGTVESVKAVNSPRSIGESVVLTSALSAVKSWRFRPATREGSPVKYRQIIPVDVVPRAATPTPQADQPSAPQ